MSLARLAVRLATVAALRDRTLAGTAISDSAITPLDTLATREPRPFVVVYTDEGEVAVKGRDLLGPDGTFALVLEIGVGAHMVQEDAWVVPPTDEGLELTLDVIDRQIRVALVDPESPWAETWRRLVKGVTRLRTRRGAPAKEGVRFAVRQIEMGIQPFAEPPFGPAATGIWAEFLGRLAGDEQLSHLEPVVRGMIEGGAPQPSWAVLQQQLGLTRPELEALHLSHRHDLGEEPIASVSGEAEPLVP